ncbi:hypothetical protein [Novosphingobium sp.]|uniref:hypothetical protein n=1 Tax=Novosphingobium sp. TaxID=1874826 RepID=UPI0038B88E3F
MDTVTAHDAQHADRRAQVGVLAFIAVATFACRIWWMTSPATDVDSPFYSLMGEALLHGQLPYVDVWDRKPIGLFLIYAAAHAALGPQPVAYLVLAALFAGAGAWFACDIARRLTSRGTGLVVSVLYLLGMDAYGSRGGQSEVFYTALCLAMAWLALARPRSLRAACLAMLLGGLALQIKYSVVPFCAVFALIALRARWNVHGKASRLAGEAALFAALGLAPTALAFATYAALGHADAFVFANFVSIFLRPVVYGRWPAQTLAAVGPIALTAMVGLWAFLRLERDVPREAYLTVLALFAGAVASVFSTANVLAFYYAFLVPWAVLLACPFIDLRAKAGRIGAGLLVAAYLVAANHPHRIAVEREDRKTFDRFAGIVMAAGQPRSLYLFYGPTSLYAATGTHGGRYPFPSHHNAAFEDGALGVPQAVLVAQALARHPRFVVSLTDWRTDPASTIAPRVDTTLRAGYRRVARGPMLDQDLTLWERRDGR